MDPNFLNAKFDSDDEDEDYVPQNDASDDSAKKNKKGITLI